LSTINQRKFSKLLRGSFHKASLFPELKAGIEPERNLFQELTG
jgi:hypothetical protein